MRQPEKGDVAADEIGAWWAPEPIEGAALAVVLGTVESATRWFTAGSSRSSVLVAIDESAVPGLR